MRYRFAIALVAIVAAIPLGGTPIGAQAPAAEHSASGFLFVKTIDQALCQTVYAGGFAAAHYTRGECIRVDFNVTNTDATSTVRADLFGPAGGAPYKTLNASRLSSGLWRVVFRSDAATPAGKSTLRVVANDVVAGDGTFFVNALGADVSAVPKTGGKTYAPGEAVGLKGSIAELNDVVGNTQKTGAPATFYLRARTPTGEVRGPYGPLHRRIERRVPGRPPAPGGGDTRPHGRRDHELPADRRRRRDRRDEHERTQRRLGEQGRRQRRCRAGRPAVDAPAGEQVRLLARLGEARPGVPVPRLREELHG